METREQHLKKLLRPIVWHWSSSIRSRQNYVIECRSRVLNVLPFLNEEELKLAKDWLLAERHEGLWD